MALLPEAWSRRFRDVVRHSNKFVLNPIMLRLAGRRHWYASTIRHTGRRSGRQYATPVVADRVRDWLIVPLPYGTKVDWLRNVLTTGHATIVRRGETYEVGAPEIIDATEALPLLTRDRRRTFERFGVEHFLRMTITPTDQ